jgi:hypothetical protein
LKSVHDCLAAADRLAEDGIDAGDRSAHAAADRRSLHDLDDAWRLTTADHPIPYSPTLEDAFLPLAGAIVADVRGRLGVAAAITA